MPSADIEDMSSAHIPAYRFLSTPSPPYLTSSIVPPFDIVAYGVLPYAPRLTRRPFGVGSSSPLRILRPLSIAGEPGS